jgi:hypothetical protein
MGNSVIRRILSVLAVVVAGVGLAAIAAGLTGSPAAGDTKPRAAAAVRHAVVYRSLHAGQVLEPGDRLVSPDGRYRALVVTSNGRLIVETTSGHWKWHTPASTRGAHLSIGSRGGMVLRSGNHNYWGNNTGGSGNHNSLTLGNDGVLRLNSSGLQVWSSALGNGCRGSHGKTVLVDISRQLARLCNGNQQLRESWVTTGASAHGMGTPTGTWHVQARIRNTTLHPASGGSFPVHYWVPYDGDYGMHDSPWQHFAYGSSRYKTHGSHGCVHFPGAVMKWMFGWIHVGNTVKVHA